MAMAAMAAAAGRRNALRFLRSEAGGLHLRSRTAGFFLPRSLPNHYHTEAQRKAAALVKELQSVVEKAPDEASIEKVRTIAKELAKSLETTSVEELASELEKLKYEFEFARTVSLTVFGIYAALLIAFPTGLGVVNMRVDEHVKKNEANDKENKKENRKLRSRVSALEAKGFEETTKGGGDCLQGFEETTKGGGDVERSQTPSEAVEEEDEEEDEEKDEEEKGWFWWIKKIWK